MFIAQRTEALDGLRYEERPASLAGYRNRNRPLQPRSGLRR